MKSIEVEVQADVFEMEMHEKSSYVQVPNDGLMLDQSIKLTHQTGSTIW